MKVKIDPKLVAAAPELRDRDLASQTSAMPLLKSRLSVCASSETSARPYRTGDSQCSRRRRLDGLRGGVSEELGRPAQPCDARSERRA